VPALAAARSAGDFFEIMSRHASCPVTTSANPGVSRTTERGLIVVVVAAHTNCRVRTSKSMASTVAGSYLLSCCTGSTIVVRVMAPH